MPEKKVYLTADGLAKLEQELEHLRTTHRHEVAQRIHLAKEMGGTDHNAEYEEAKNEQAFVEGRILTLEQTIKNTVVIPAESASHDQVKLGCRVTVRNQDRKEEHYTIVGPAEANPTEGKISYKSPVGEALLGKSVGEMVEVVAPAAVLRLQIIEIQ